MSKITEPGVAVLSGPIERASELVRALQAAGIGTVEDLTPAGHPHRGLPDHVNPQAAAQAGAPNAGHTPHSQHPESGEAYEADPNVGWVDVPLDPPGILEEVVELAQAVGYRLRAHSSELVTELLAEPGELSVQERLDQVEQHLAAIHRARGL